MNLLIVLLLSSCLSSGQIEKSKILTSETGIPVDWQDSLIKKNKWVLVQMATIKNGKVKDIQEVKNKNSVYYFQNDSVIMLPFRIDTVRKLRIKYFEPEKTFYASTHIQSKDTSYSEQRFPYRVIYLNGNYLVLEDLLNDMHFDMATGKILSDEEVKNRTEDYAKARGKPLFGGIEIDTRKKIKYLGIYKAD